MFSLRLIRLRIRLRSGRVVQFGPVPPLYQAFPATSQTRASAKSTLSSMAGGVNGVNDVERVCSRA